MVLALLTRALVLGVLLAGCSADGSGAACVRSADCEAGFGCTDGRCVAADSGAPPVDSAVRDTGPLPDRGRPVGGGCSADLRTVLDASGSALFDCPVDQGCAMGLCLPACDAARASGGNVGCEFLVPSPPAYPPALPPCLAVFVTNTWPVAAQLTVTRDGATYDVATFGRIVDNATPPAAWAPVPAIGLPADEVAVLFLTSDPLSIMPENSVPLSCPVTPAIDASTVVPGTGIGPAFVITSDMPVGAYDILPYGGARSHFPSAQLLLPSSAWGTGYVLIATPPGTHTVPGPLWGQVLALRDNTTVRIAPTVGLAMAPGLPAIAAGTIGTFTLAAGQYAQWELAPGSTDLSGSIVEADKPVGVFAGSRFFRLQPTPGPGGDATHQQILPVDALGSAYVAAPFETRRADLMPEAVHYRLVGVVDGTVLTFDPAIAGAPATLNRAEVADFTATEPFQMSSQAPAFPFAAAQIMATANVPGGSRPGATAPIFAPMLGDEEFVVMFPPAQFLERYVFFTDPAYATTSLTVTRVRQGDLFAPVTIDCIGNVGGWRPVGTAGLYEVTTVDLLRADVPVGTCANGRHVAESAGPFGIVVWGLDTYSSYAYPAGGNAGTLTDLPPLI